MDPKNDPKSTSKTSKPTEAAQGPKRQRKTARDRSRQEPEIYDTINVAIRPKQKTTEGLLQTSSTGMPGHLTGIASSAPASSVQPLVARKRKRSTDDDAEDDDNLDFRFLRQTRERLIALAQPRHPNVDAILNYLEKMKPPQQESIVSNYPDRNPNRQTPIDAYILTRTSARHLLQSNDPITAPVFVPNSTNTTGIIDPDNPQRPLEQLLSWFTNPTETHELPNSDETLTTQDLKSLFLDPHRHDPPVRTNGLPHNFPDLPHPFHHPGMPLFLQNPQCSLLRDIMRVLLDIGPRDLCNSSCGGISASTSTSTSTSTGLNDGRSQPPNQNTNQHRPAPKCRANHFLTPDELVLVQQGWRSWQGSVMLAMPGACTLPHADKWGFGTWVCCVEGEMGFAWMVPSSSSSGQEGEVVEEGEEGGEEQGRMGSRYRERMEHVLDATGDEKADEQAVRGGRWVFRVLRPGESVYIGPGTVHCVFRLPEGRQTAGLAGHVVRKRDFGLWVDVLGKEAKVAVGRRRGIGKGDENGDGEGKGGLGLGGLVRALAVGIEEMRKVVVREGREEEYGGSEGLEGIKRVARRLLRTRDCVGET